MSKSRKKKKYKSKKASQRTPPESVETRAADAMTVFWMVSFLATLAAELAFAGAFLLNRNQPSETGTALTNAMFLISVLCGVSTLLATPVTLTLRSVEPPKRIVLLAILISSVPLVALASSLMRT